MEKNTENKRKNRLSQNIERYENDEEPHADAAKTGTIAGSASGEIDMRREETDGGKDWNRNTAAGEMGVSRDVLTGGTYSDAARDFNEVGADQPGSDNRGKRSRRAKIKAAIAVAAAVAVVTGVFMCCSFLFDDSPKDLIREYAAHIEKQEYDEMYDMVNVSASGDISKERFIERNSAIYEGIGASNIKIDIKEYNVRKKIVTYQMSLDTKAGRISFENSASFKRTNGGYGLVWNDGLIFPGLTSDEKVRVATEEASRGSILDRNGLVLAGPNVASSVGIVPGKLKNREAAVQEVASLLEMTPEAIEKKLSASWIKDDSFVPLRTLQKVENVEMTIPEDEAKLAQERARQASLLEIPGVMITDTQVRSYPLGKAAAHLVGYVQSVTAEDLKKHEGEGYAQGSVIGRSGIESLYEKELRGQNGCRIYILDDDGQERGAVAELPRQDGQDVQLTIDANLQNLLYQQFQTDKSCSAAINPYTGEVLALVSTPSFDSNDFVLGMTDEMWTKLSENVNKPMYNRFRQTWCPGSTFKPVTAAIGLISGAIDPSEDYGSEGLSWQKDSSWGSYHITTLHTYSPVVLENALIYSDNIYFAKAALKIGANEFEESLKNIGFSTEMPFEIEMSKSQYSNTQKIESEIQLADSGYGQGQILVNPLHLACIYTAFCNQGNVLRPRLLFDPKAQTEYWIPGAFSGDAAETVLNALTKVVNDPHGTGYAARRNDVLLAGKTGTAEIKSSQDDTSGTELGWFAVFTPDSAQQQVMIVSMVEDVKGRGGSGYVVDKSRQVLDRFFRAA